MKDSLLLLSNFVKNPKEVGAIIPSSRFLANDIVSNIDFKKSKNIVELGPGIGTFTRIILKKARQDTRIFCFEVNNKFCNYLNKNIIDKRLVVINAGAEKIGKKLKKFGIEKADCIVSGLPFLNFSIIKKRRIIKEVKNSLCSNGKFVLFQYTNGLGKMLELYFDEVNRSFIPFNVPPAFVYVCRKRK